MRLFYQEFRIIVWRWVASAGFILCILLSTTYAGYKSQKAKVDPAPSYVCHVKQGLLTIAADPYQTWEKMKTVFDLKELDKMGVIPIQVIVTNDGEDTVVVDGTEIHLLDGKNRPIEGMAVDEVVRSVLGKVDPTSPKTSSPSPIPFPRSSGHRGDIFDIQTDLSNKAFGEVRVAPKSTFGGFLFFRLPDQQRVLNGYKVYVPDVKNLRSGEELLFFEIELK